MMQISHLRDTITTNDNLSRIIEITKTMESDIMTNFVISYEDGSRIHATKIGHGSGESAVVGLHGMLPGKELWSRSYQLSHQLHPKKHMRAVDIHPHGDSKNPHHGHEALFDKKYGDSYNHITQSHIRRFVNFLKQEEGIDRMILESTSKGGYDAMLYHALFPEQIIANILAAPSGAQERIVDRKKLGLLLQLARINLKPLVRKIINKHAEEMVGLSQGSLSQVAKESIIDYVYTHIAGKNFRQTGDLIKTITAIDENETMDRLPELSDYATDIHIARSQNDPVTQPEGLVRMSETIGIPTENRKIFDQGGHAILLGKNTKEAYRNRRDAIIQQY